MFMALAAGLIVLGGVLRWRFRVFANLCIGAGLVFALVTIGLGVQHSAAPAAGPQSAAAEPPMAPGDRQAMIEAMVDRLAARLKAKPRDANGWVRLMRSRMVLGDSAAARQALADAQAAFADDPAQQRDFQTVADELAITQN